MSGPRDSVSLMEAASSPNALALSNPGKAGLLEDPMAIGGSFGFHNTKPSSPQFKDESRAPSSHGGTALPDFIAEEDEPQSS